MARYRVTVAEVHTFDLDVEADDRDQALHKANDLVQQGKHIEMSVPVEYSHTMDMDWWNVEPMEEIEAS